MVTPVLLGLHPFLGTDNPTLIPSLLRDDNVKVYYSASLFVACACYLYYTVLIFEEEGLSIPLYQRIGLSVAWVCTSVHGLGRDLLGLAKYIIPCVAAGGWLVASGFVSTAEMDDFETATVWLWYPALHYVVFHTAVFCALESIRSP